MDHVEGQFGVLSHENGGDDNDFEGFFPSFFLSVVFFFLLEQVFFSVPLINWSFVVLFEARDRKGTRQVEKITFVTLLLILVEGF